MSNAIKKDHQNYLNAGGLGFLLGDGHLNYGRENIVETYYTVHVWRGIYLAPGLQHIVNPGLPSPPPMTIAGLELRSNFDTCCGVSEILPSHVICMCGT